MSRTLTWALGAGLFPALALAAPAVEVSQDLHHDVSRPARELATPFVRGAFHLMPLRLTPMAPPGGEDGALQREKPRSRLAVTPGLNLVGVGTGFSGPQGRFSPNAAPPDTNGAVGDTQVVEWVNSSYAVFDKSTGSVLMGPVAGNKLWSGFGGGCQTNNDGDIVVLFDKTAHRWVFTQFSVSTTPYLQCMAVSQTNDATGAFYRYSFQQPNFNDYPKLGTWPDAYYMSFNIFSGNSFTGPRACAMNRAAMLTGAAATQECFQLGNSYGTLLPGDLDGTAAPPAGSPDYYASYTTNALQLWSFHSDFSNPANATFTGPTQIPVAAFSAACNGGTCIPQAGTKQKLDSLADRLMFRLAYRNFPAASPAHESLVVTQSVKAGSVASGVRWYELRSPGSNPSVYQSGTYSPDSTSRWMSSAAMDKNGDILVGYSGSSSSLHPSVRVSGRLVTDTPGTLESEVVAFQGNGSQSGQRLSRWGDYSGMSIDPSDDCTFWYFNEYEPATGAFNWATRAVSYKFTSCQ